MNKPNTDFVLIRGPRSKDENGFTGVEVKIIRNDNTFDFSEYSFLCVRSVQSADMEEWVPTKELDLYKKAFGVE